MRLRTTLLGFVLLCVVPGVLLAQKPDRGTAETVIGPSKISINYGRPSLKGRDILAQVPVGKVWRLGRNQATEIESTGDLLVAGKEVKAGKYSLWVKKTGDDTWILAFHPATGIWGEPAKTDGYVAELPLKLGKASDSAEELVISLSNKGKDALIDIHWGTAELTGAFSVK
jgi:hypothetical protein